MKLDYRHKDQETKQYDQFDSFDARWSDAYRVVEKVSPELFDAEKNGLQGLPKLMRFSILSTLAVMWAFIFAIITAEFIHFGIHVTTSIIAHILVIAGIMYTRKELNSNYKFNTYHTQTRSRQNLWVNGKQTELPKNDPGGEHE
jgi:hypothetical protein